MGRQSDENHDEVTCIVGLIIYFSVGGLSVLGGLRTGYLVLHGFW